MRKPVYEPGPTPMAIAQISEIEIAFLFNSSLNFCKVYLTLYIFEDYRF